jgi:hypothetical protein
MRDGAPDGALTTQTSWRLGCHAGNEKLAARCIRAEWGEHTVSSLLHTLAPTASLRPPRASAWPGRSGLEAEAGVQRAAAVGRLITVIIGGALKPARRTRVVNAAHFAAHKARTPRRECALRRLCSPSLTAARTAAPPACSMATLATPGV